MNDTEQNENSYGHVLKYTGIFGGVQGLNILISLVRNKLVALLLGPAGMGLAALFNSVVNFVSQATSFGISFSAVRHLSEIFDSGDSVRIRTFVNTVRAWCAVAALLGMAGANLTAELDNAILDQNADHDMNALRERLRRSKMTMELYCKAGQTTPDEVRAAFRRDAERKMRSILAVQAIAKAEQITVSNAEVDAEYVRLSKLHDTPEAEIRNVLSRDAVASAVTTQKVQRFLIDHANITSVVEKE